MNTLSQKRSEAGRRGGMRTLEKHGIDHFKKIGAIGAQVLHQRYRLAPVGQDNFALVNRQTNEVKAFLNGLPF